MSAPDADADVPPLSASHRGIAGVQRVAVVGCGLIGASWAAQFLAAGLEVVATDPAPDAKERLLTEVSSAWPALSRLGRACTREPPGPAFTPCLEEAVADVDWVQESVPDDERLKLQVLRQIDKACPSQAIIASSTSGIVPTFLQSACAHPERLLVGHPFNPVHILPLVEVVPGSATSTAVIARAMSFYEALGKKPLRVRAEVPGFIANRLQEALCREAFHLVNDGVCTTSELDAVVANGPGLRLSLFGPVLVYWMGGGGTSMGEAIRQFEPGRVQDWSHNSYPEMTEGLIKALDEQAHEESEGRRLEEWEELRDRFLVRLVQLRDEAMAEFRHRGVKESGAAETEA